MDPQDRFGPFVHWEEYTDNELMARASAGDSKAYETLVLRYRSVQEDFLDAVALKESSPEEEYLKKESRDHVMEWLRELPDHQREALYLFCVEGMSYGEIARHMGKTAAQIKIWIYRFMVCA